MTHTDERPLDELSPSSSLEALHARFELMTGTPREKFTLRWLRVERFGRWVIVTGCFTTFPIVRVRISVQWAEYLRAELNRVLPS